MNTQNVLASRFRYGVILLVLCCPSALNGQDKVKTALTVTFDFDWAIEETEKQLAQSAAHPSRDALLYCAVAYYKKGMLLQTAYEANLWLSSLYYDCRETKSPLLAPSYFLPFARAVLCVAREEYKTAAAHLRDFHPPDQHWRAMTAIWSECVGEKVGASARSPRADASKYGDASERQMLRIVLGLHASKNAGLSLTQDVSDSRLARNRILVSLDGLSRAEKVKLLHSLNPGQPMFLKASSEASTEVYFDILSLLAAARCALSISRDLFMDLNGRLQNGERTTDEYAAVTCTIGELSFLLGDCASAVETLRGDPYPTSSVYLGASYFKLHDKQKAEEVWRAIEGSADGTVLSWLGYIYAKLGINLERAEALSGKLISDREQSQQYAARHAAVLDKAGKDVLGVYGGFYDYEHRGILNVRANEPGFTIMYCAALQRFDPSHIALVNELLFSAQKKYPYLFQLYEASTGLNACREILSGRK